MTSWSRISTRRTWPARTSFINSARDSSGNGPGTNQKAITPVIKAIPSFAILVAHTLIAIFEVSSFLSLERLQFEPFEEEFRPDRRQKGIEGVNSLCTWFHCFASATRLKLQFHRI
jgi:hypothetical protein